MVTLAWNLGICLALFIGFLIAACFLIGFLEGVLGYRIFGRKGGEPGGQAGRPLADQTDWDPYFCLPPELFEPRKVERKVEIPIGWRVHPAPRTTRRRGGGSRK